MHIMHLESCARSGKLLVDNMVDAWCEAAIDDAAVKGRARHTGASLAEASLELIEHTFSLPWIHANTFVASPRLPPKAS